MPGIDDFTKLILHFSGSQGSTDFIDSSFFTHTINPQDDALISTTQSIFDPPGSSGFFDGVGDFLELPNSTDYDFGSGDLTIDWWEFKLEPSTNFGSIWQRRRNISGQAVWVLSVGAHNFPTDGHNNVRSTVAGALSITMDMGTYDYGVWNHFAFSRKSGVGYTFKNGTLIETKAFATDFDVPETPATIGTSQGPTNPGDYKGYIQELRVSKGIARWSGSFTPDTEPYSEEVDLAFSSIINVETEISGILTKDIIQVSSDINIETEVSANLTEENIQLSATINIETEITLNLHGSVFVTTLIEDFGSLVHLVHFDEPNGALETVDEVTSFTLNVVRESGNSAMSSTDIKFDNNYLLDIGTSYITASNSIPTQYGDNNWTIDFWYRFIDRQGAGHGFYNDGAINISYNNRFLNFSQIDSGSNLHNQNTRDVFDSSSNWVHRAFVRDGSTVHVYDNGTEITTFTPFNLKDGVLQTIARQEALGSGTGRMDEMRVSTEALWTADFTPPTAPATIGEHGIEIVTQVLGSLTEVPIQASTNILIATEITCILTEVPIQLSANINIETGIEGDITGPALLITADINVVTDINGNLSEENIPLTSAINVVTDINGILTEENIQLAADINVVTEINGILTKETDLLSTINIVTDINGNLSEENIPLTSTINVVTQIDGTIEKPIGGAIINIQTVLFAGIQRLISFVIYPATGSGAYEDTWLRSTINGGSSFTTVRNTGNLTIGPTTDIDTETGAEVKNINAWTWIQRYIAGFDTDVGLSNEWRLTEAVYSTVANSSINNALSPEDDVYYVVPIETTKSGSFTTDDWTSFPSGAHGSDKELITISGPDVPFETRVSSSIDKTGFKYFNTSGSTVLGYMLRPDFHNEDAAITSSAGPGDKSSVDWYTADDSGSEVTRDPCLELIMGFISTAQISADIDIVTSLASTGVDTSGKKGERADIFIVTEITGIFTEDPVLFTSDINIVTILQADPHVGKQLDSTINIVTEITGNLTEENIQLTADINIETEIDGVLTEIPIIITADINIETEITGDNSISSEVISTIQIQTEVNASLEEENIQLTADINIETEISGSLEEENIPLTADINILTEVNASLEEENIQLNSTINIVTEISGSLEEDNIQLTSSIDILTDITSNLVQQPLNIFSTIQIETEINGSLEEENIPLTSTIVISTDISANLTEDTIQLTSTINVVTQVSGVIYLLIPRPFDCEIIDIHIFNDTANILVENDTLNFNIKCNT